MTTKSLLYNSVNHFPSESTPVRSKFTTITEVADYTRQYGPGDPMLESPLFALAERERIAALEEVLQLLRERGLYDAFEAVKDIPWIPTNHLIDMH